MLLLEPTKDQIKTYYIPQEEIRDENQNKLTETIRMNEDLVLARLPFAYEGYNVGFYVTSIRSNYLPSDLSETLNMKMEEMEIPSSSYISTNLLRNAFKKVAKNTLGNIECKKKFYGEDFCIELDHQTANNDKLSDYLFNSFCSENPELCGEKESLCSKIFTVVKRYYFRFQHTKNDKDHIYLTINMSYGIRQHLELNYILSLVGGNIKDKDMYGIMVNYKRNKDSHNEICRLESLEIASNKVVLECSRRKETLDITSKDIFISINPVYSSSRLFLQKLCESYDTYKTKLSKRLNPKIFYEIITNDMDHLIALIENNLMLNGINYNINKQFVVIQ